MKKTLVLTIILLSVTCPTFSQVKFSDYRDGACFTIENSIYKTKNSVDKVMDKPIIQERGIAIAMSNTVNTRMNKIGLYTDGHYAEDYEEVSGIIQGKQSNDDTVYAAVRKAFTKEELIAHPDWIIFVFVVVDNTGRIIETSSVIKIRHDYVIQPEQVHILETALKNTLVFTLDQEKASKFKWFEGQIMIRFKDYIEDRPLTKIDNFIENPNL